MIVLWQMKSTTILVFAERLKKTSHSAGITTPTALARSCGVLQQSVSKYWSGESTPSAENLAAICDFLGVSSDYLLGIDNDSERRPSLGVIANNTVGPFGQDCRFAQINLPTNARTAPALFGGSDLAFTLLHWRIVPQRGRSVKCCPMVRRLSNQLLT